MRLVPVVCYVSGHGFGHAVRVAEILRAVARREPSVLPLIRTPLQREFFDLDLGGGFEYAAVRLDVGVVQTDSLSVDPEASLLAYASLAARAPELVAAEVAALRPRRPRLVLADIPALAFDVAAGLGVPGVALANFSWDWIYADYVADLPRYRGVVDALVDSYGRASLLLRLPMHGDLDAFPRVQDIPLVARLARLERDEVRRRLGLDDRRVVLLSFGGIGLSLDVVPRLPGVDFITTGAARRAAAPCRTLSNQEMRAAGVRYEDLVAASDAVVTKPGYGIVAECIANGTPIVYTSRGRFAEYELLVEGIRGQLPNAFLGNEQLRAGRWEAALEEVLAAPKRAPAVRTDGAEVAAEILCGLLAERG